MKLSAYGVPCKFIVFLLFVLDTPKEGSHQEGRLAEPCA